MRHALAFGTVVLLLLTDAAFSQTSWPMRQRDAANTGRADFAIPAARQGPGLFTAVSWQAPSPGGPDNGAFSSGQMVYFDGAGPGGADLVVGSYHWPKGVQGMNRHTGQVYWAGNPDGGESIGANAAAFSPAGTTVYVTNDATPGTLMAFGSAVGPSDYWSNAGSNDVDAGAWSPKVLSDGRIVTSNWCDSVLCFADSGAALTRTARAESSCSCYPGSAAFQDGPLTRVYTPSRCGFVTCYNGADGAQLWRTNVGPATDAGVTADPLSGNLYVNIGVDDVYVVGLDKFGQPLWPGGPGVRVYDWVSGVNNPQRAQSAGALSHDAGTYYFQTVSQQGDGLLYAINTADGQTRWVYPTLSRGWEMQASSPIVTPNGVVIVGNNGGRRYFVIRDDAIAGTLLATFDSSPGGSQDGIASASAMLSADGFLYLPVRTGWTYPYAGGPTPTGAVSNVFTAFDLRENPEILLPGPTKVRAFAGNASVRISWQPISADPQVFSHYAVYRETSAFSSIAGLTPIATFPSMAADTFTDTSAQNGVSYHYAVSAVAVGGGEREQVQSIGPRTPRDESDLQVVSISRTPRYPRYAPDYANLTVTEPGGFGPYNFSVATGLGMGQTSATQRFPNPGDPVTYTAQVRNRGTNAWSTPVNVTWTVDGSVQQSGVQPVSLAPGASASFAYTRSWEDTERIIGCSIDAVDARAANNSRQISTRSVAFLSYVDRTYLEDFREQTPDYPQSTTDDLLDWLNRHMDRFNQMFADAPAGGTPKRVHFDVLEVLDDDTPDPAIDTIPFAVFPFRYRAGEGTLRLSGYFSAADDIDYGLLHEMGHQLGLIDLYRLDTPASVNQVSGTPYFTFPGLMHGVSPFLSENSSHALTHWYLKAHGYYGQYLYSLPESCRVRVLGYGDQPVVGATVSVYQRCERPGVGDVISDQVKFQGTTDSQGVYTLPNVPIDTQLAPPAFNGDYIRPNPFGYIAVVGSNGLLLLKIEKDGFADYAWLDITEVNNAYYDGQASVATFDRRVALGGPIQTTPPRDMTESNATEWFHAAEDGALTLSDDTAIRDTGAASLRAVATGGGDNTIRYPGAFRARWNLSGVNSVVLHARAINNNSPQFQNLSPTVRLLSRDGYIQLQPHDDVLNGAVTQWVTFTIPLAGNAEWTRTELGSPDISAVSGLEIHADTWGAGFTLWLDGVGFDPSPCPADFNGSGSVSVQDIFDFLGAYFAVSPAADFNRSGAVSVQDIFDFLSAYFSTC